MTDVYKSQEEFYTFVQVSTFAYHSQHFSDIQNKLHPHKFSDLVYLFMSDMHGNYQGQVNLRE